MITPKGTRNHLPISQVSPQETLLEKLSMLDAGKTQS